jgi:flavin reductase (DIM6/NTAB) family NADH-FMN oxidoreductase RutF
MLIGDTTLKTLPAMMKQMSTDGLFLTTKAMKLNTMVIGWGGVNIYFRIPIFIVPVRTSRYTHEQMEDSKYFTVSVPQFGELKKALAFCGTKSGKDFDKFAECNLTAVPGRTVDVPVIKECYLHYECKIIYKQHMVPETLNKNLNEQVYPNSDYHTFYFGKILACYENEG